MILKDIKYAAANLCGEVQRTGPALTNAAAPLPSLYLLKLFTNNPASFFISASKADFEDHALDGFKTSFGNRNALNYCGV